ncbi:MAG: glycogen/starch synthase, partial [Candidatus Saccharimonas aalborgensis]
MNILMLGWELPPHYVGGMGVVCDQLTKQMVADGADIEFVLPFRADFSAFTHMKVTAAIDQDAET